VKERVRVHCRLRPTREECERTNRANQNDQVMLSTFLTKEGQAKAPTRPVIKDYDSQGNFVFDRSIETANCKYDTFLPTSSTQEETYNKCAKSIVHDAMDGYAGTILVYGQTGSGKTHTMVGPPQVRDGSNPNFQNGDYDEASNTVGPETNAIVQVEGMRGDDRGLIPRALYDIFKTIKDRSEEVAYTVRMSYVQIYCELILDLLDEDDPAAIEGRKANVRENADGEVYLDGAIAMEVKSAEQCLTLLDLGNQNRVTACTRMNATSSRSHAVLQLQIEGRNIADNERRADGKQKVFRGKLFLVDLAGSERVSKSGVLYQQFTELKSINLSLCALGNCVAALAQENKHIPYRDSKLTRLLQNSLGGNSKTSMVITISPADEDRAESWNAVQFGHRAMKIPVRFGPTANIN
jgi:kinesin family protein 5